MDVNREDEYRSVGLALVTREASRRLDDLAAHAVAALDEAAIPSLLLRGPAIARWLYDDPSERPYQDVDLLVAPDRHGAAARALTSSLGARRVLEGAAASEQAPHADTFEADAGDLDLHWTLKGIGAPPETVWAAMSRAPERLQVAGVAVRVPGPGARALTVALHAAQHGPQSPVAQRDAERAVQRLPQWTWVQAAALARELDAITWFAAGLAAVPGGDGVLRELRIVAEPDLDVATRAQGDVPMLRGIAELSRTRGLSARARLIAREAFPSRAFMREWSSLPERGALGLAAAYAYRPFWLARHLAPALAAYRRAREASRSR